MVSGPTSRAVGRLLEEEEKDDGITVLPISGLGCSSGVWDTLWIKDHCRNTVSYPKRLRIKAVWRI